VKSPNAPIERTIVLLGAGNANLQVIRWWAMDPISGTELLLISDTLMMPYSGMLPGCLAGLYRIDDVMIDVGRLCAKAGVRLIHARATKVNTVAKVVELEGRPPLRYDLLAVNIGSQPHVPIEPGARAHSLLLKPLHTLTTRADALDDRIAQSGQPSRLVCVGGGASGFEITMALRKRYGHHANLSYEILVSGDRVLSGAAPGVSDLCAQILAEQGIAVRHGARVSGGDGRVLQLESGQAVPYDICVWATPAAPLELIQASGFETTTRGFIRAHDTLQTLSDPNVFAAGDCVTLESSPDLPKAGVFSVREGPVLWDNLKAAVSGDELRPYRPQKLYLFLLNASDGTAVMSYGSAAGRGKWVLAWKNFIDRKWMRQFHDLYLDPDDDPDADSMRCGGCGAKLGHEILYRVLKRLEIPAHPSILAGVSTGEDAAVQRLPEGRVAVQTVDFFREFLADPYLFGRIAALNALSDVYAMHATPLSALATVTIPYAGSRVREEQLYQSLSGAVETFRQHDVVLAGGHSSESVDFQLGFTVTGHADETTLFRKSALKDGDNLIVTKPLGTGALMRAVTLGQCAAEWYRAVVEGMLVSNRDAASVLAELGVAACTDVTGFGLAGHLVEMLTASSCRATLQISSIPLYDGLVQVLARGVRSTLHDDNATIAARILSPAGQIPAWLFDPQTSGGLLAGVPATRADEALEALSASGYAHAACIGTVEACKAGESPGLRLRVE